jgi:2-keto-4-pentenoate hydratase/2-oxohepta-3-ene-1,7-dioic acid hydratase in catechol pathway
MIICAIYISIPLLHDDQNGEIKLKIARYLHRGAESYGVLKENKVIDLPRLSKLKGVPIPQDIAGLVSLGSRAETLLTGIMDKPPKAQNEKFALNVNEVTLKAPVKAPPKILCLGLNYRDHAEEAGMPLPDEPIIFMKPRTAIIGPEQPVIKPAFVEKLDYEVELAVVMGRKGRNIPVSAAADYVFGYTVFNDISARDIQFKDGQWTRGKSFDTFAPTGPCITTAAQINDPNNLRLSTRVNGETRQDSSTNRMVFNVSEVIHHLSRIMTLELGDVIATGTPAGVAAFMKPEPKYLQLGDTVEVEVENIGVLKNPVTKE